MFPVEVRYCPIDEEALESGETTYVDAAVDAVRELLTHTAQGDILVFMPSERDIQECCGRLAAGRGDAWEVVPLYGRLSGGEQQRVFAPGAQRRLMRPPDREPTLCSCTGLAAAVSPFWQVFGKLDAKSPCQTGWTGPHQTDRPGARSGGIAG